MLTPDQADLILRKDLANIIAKSKAGKPLTKAERTALSTATAGESGGYSINALSDLTGADRRTLKKALRGVTPLRTEGMTSFYKLESATQALAARPQNNADRESLFCQKTLKQIEMLTLQLDRQRGKYIEADEVRFTWLSHIQQARTILLSCPAELAPSLCGLSAPEIERRLVERMDAAIAALAANPLGGAP